MARFAGTISLDIPEGAGRLDVASYILDAVRCWRGSLRPPYADGTDIPGDPMFSLDPDSVSVTYQDKGVTYKVVDNDD